MKIRKYNKASAVVLAGAAATIIGAFITLEPTVLAAVQTLLTAALVWKVRNAT